MLRRAFDVLFQNGGRCLAGLILVPLVLGAGTAVIARTELVSTRLWVDRPPFSADVSVLGQQDPLAPPAATEEALLQEVLASDAFVDRILGAVTRGYRGLSGAARFNARSAFRANLSVLLEGDHTIVLSYKDPSALHGEAVLTELVRAFSKYVDGLQYQEAATQGGVAQSQINEAKTALDHATHNLQTYAASVSDKSTLKTDPTFVSLLAQANAATARYQNLVGIAQQSALAKAAAPILQREIFQVVDGPSIQPSLLGGAPVLKVVELSFALVMLSEAALVYVIARRDPRLRTAEDATQWTGLRLVSTIPTADPL